MLNLSETDFKNTDSWPKFSAWSRIWENISQQVFFLYDSPDRECSLLSKACVWIEFSSRPLQRPLRKTVEKSQKNPDLQLHLQHILTFSFIYGNAEYICWGIKIQERKIVMELDQIIQMLKGKTEIKLVKFISRIWKKSSWKISKNIKCYRNCLWKSCWRIGVACLCIWRVEYAKKIQSKSVIGNR